MGLPTVFTVLGLGLDIAVLTLLAHELLNGPPAALKAYWDQKQLDTLQQDAKVAVDKARSQRPRPATAKPRRRAARERKKDKKYLHAVPKKVDEVRQAEKALTEHVYALNPPQPSGWVRGRWVFGLLITGLLLQMAGAIMGAA